MTFTGRLGKDCQVNQVGDKTVINFNFAHSFKTKDGEQTTWIGCSYWKESKVSDYLKKGTLVLVEGTPEVTVYEGNPQLKCRVMNLELLGGNQETPLESKVTSQANQNSSAPKDYANDDLPF